VQLGRWHDKPIGPHPQAMYQVAFLPSQFGKVVPWLMLHRERLYLFHKIVLQLVGIVFVSQFPNIKKKNVSRGFGLKFGKQQKS